MLERLNARLERLEQWAADGSMKPLPYVPIVILGSPRSGTTLLFQFLVASYDLAFTANLHHALFGWPALAERIGRVTRWPRTADYSSDAGRTRGPRGVSEFWRYWYRFFPKSAEECSLDRIDLRRMEVMRGSFRALMRAFGRPAVSKNLPAAFRLAALQKFLPETLYLVISRNELASAVSILAARKRIRGDYARWWSIRPPNLETLKHLAPEHQVIEQIRATEQAIVSGSMNSNRFLTLTYEELCRDPPRVATRIESFLDLHGVEIRRIRPLPASFEMRPTPKIDPELEVRLRAQLKATEGGRGVDPA